MDKPVLETRHISKLFDMTQALDDVSFALYPGEIHALVLQHPINLGYLGVKTAVQVLKGETVERRIDTGSTMITKELLFQFNRKFEGFGGQRTLKFTPSSVNASPSFKVP